MTISTSSFTFSSASSSVDDYGERKKNHTLADTQCTFEAYCLEAELPHSQNHNQPIDSKNYSCQYSALENIVYINGISYNM